MRALLAGAALALALAGSVFAGQPVTINSAGNTDSATVTNHKLDVNATFTGSIAGFRPASHATPITATTGGVTATIPANTGEIVAYNTGASNIAYCALGGTATTSDNAIQPNSWIGFAVLAGDTQLTCITSTSTTSVSIVGGSGVPTGAGGGSGGSGSNAAAGATGSGVPADGSYNALNLSGTLQGQTGVNPSGSVYAAQTDLTSVAGTTMLGGTGAVGAGSPRVAVARDVTTVAGSAPGTAGSASANVVTVQGVTSMTPVQVSQATAASLNATVVGTGTFATQSAITAASGSINSGAVASGAYASGAYASGSIASGACALGCIVDLGTGVSPAANTTNNYLQTLSGAVTSSVVQSNTKQVNGVTTLAGAGAVGTGSQRVAVGQDTTTIAGSAPGTAGTASGNVVTVQGVTSMTPVQVSQATGTNLHAVIDSGSTTAVTGSTSNASSGVATGSVSVPTIAYGYGFNGTTWDQLQVDGSKYLKVDVAAGSTGNACATVNTGSAVPAPACFIGGGAAAGAGNLTGVTVKAGSTAAVATDTSLVVDAVPTGALLTAINAGMATPGSATLTGANTVQIGGGDGTNARVIHTDTSGDPTVTGTGTAGSAAAGVVTVQGIASMTPLLSTLQTQTDTVMVGGVNVKEINAVTPLMGNGVTGTGSQRVTIASDNTAFNVIGNVSTNNANAVPHMCGSHVYKHITSATDTQIVAASGSTTIYVCDISFSASGALNFYLEKATSGTCATLTQIDMLWTLAANAAKAITDPYYQGLNTGASAQLCVNTSAGNLDIAVTYDQY